MICLDGYALCSSTGVCFSGDLIGRLDHSEHISFLE